MSKHAAAAMFIAPSADDADLDIPRGRVTPDAAHVRQVADTDNPATNRPSELQQELAEAWALGAFDRRHPSIEKWSVRRTVAFLFVTCGAFWCALAWAIVKLF